MPHSAEPWLRIVFAILASLGGLVNAAQSQVPDSSPTGLTPPSDLASGDLASGDLASGDLASGELASGELASGGSALDSAITPSGLRRLAGEHVVILTDVPESAETAELPQVVDLAVERMCAFFHVPTVKIRGWKLRGYLMAHPERFRQHGLLNDDLPPFKFGYQRGYEFWVYQQRADYFRRHLVIHEVVHAFMYRFLGGVGPAWYQEGIAELLATHRWKENELRLNQWPDDRRNYPDWGRIKLLRERQSAGRSRSIPEVMQLSGRQFQEVDAYAWSWGLTAFLSRHPAYRPSFDRMASQLRRPVKEFNRQLYEMLLRVDPPIEEAWRMYLAELDYGYSVADDVIQQGTAASIPVQRGQPEVVVRSDLGWQSSGRTVQQGRCYRLRASGRYVLKGGPPPWSCEAGGITLEYYRGNPLGMLMLAVRPARSNSRSAAGDSDPETQTESQGEMSAQIAARRMIEAGDHDVPVRARANSGRLEDPFPIGLGGDYTAEWAGTIYFRVNEPAGRRADNVGQVAVFIEPQRSSAAPSEDASTE